MDWLPLDALLAPLSDQAGIKVLWFGEIAGHASDIADEMISKGTLVSTPIALGSAVTKLELEGRIDVAGSAAPDEPGMVSLTMGSAGTLLRRCGCASRLRPRLWTIDGQKSPSP